MKKTVLIVLFLFVFLLFANEDRIKAQDTSDKPYFRMDSVVHLENDDVLTQIKTSTIFSDGAVFDFIGDNGEITIYRPESKIFILLDPIHRIQTELALEKIDSFLDRIRSLFTQKDDLFKRFMAHPEFDFSKSEDGNEFLFQSKWIDYRIKTRSFEDPNLIDSFFDFSDAYSKLNIYLNPGTTTPFARIHINQYLRKDHRFPEHFTLSVYPGGKRLFSKAVKIESQHTLIRRLSEKDKGRIIRALHFVEQFQKLPFGKYQKTLQNTL